MLPREAVREHAMSTANVIVVLIGGGITLYKMDNGQGDRTSPDISAKTASD
jgi:hypothetical protein